MNLQIDGTIFAQPLPNAANVLVSVSGWASDPLFLEIGESSMSLFYPRTSKPSQAASQWFCTLGLLVGVTGCGAKTGLRVPDVMPPQDVTVVDAMDVVDVVDAVDVVDVANEPEVFQCVPGRFNLERRGAEIMFVIDRSNSMAFTLDGRPGPMPGEQNRWQVLRDAFAQTLPMFERSVAFGAKFFPQFVADQGGATIEQLCTGAPGIDLAPAPGNSAALLRFFETTRPSGGTPTFDGLSEAGRYLRARPGRGQARYIVLATDGGPNCNAMNPIPFNRCVCTSSNQAQCGADPNFGVYNCLDETRTIDVIRNLASPDAPGATAIPVFVVGIDAPMVLRPELLDVLDRMAIAGGRPRMPANPRSYYSVQSPRDLTDAFSTIATSITRCAYVTPSRPNDPNEINIELNNVGIRRDPQHMEGWDWTDIAFGEITFYGNACRAAAMDGAQVGARVGCNDL